MADFIPLARAAALAHERLFPEQPSKDYKTLDVIALALSALMPLYQRVDAFLLHHRVELRAVGEHQAHALDRDVEHLPALVGLAHLEVDRQRLAAGAHELRAHGGLVLLGLVAARGQHLERLALI